MKKSPVIVNSLPVLTVIIAAFVVLIVVLNPEVLLAKGSVVNEAQVAFTFTVTVCALIITASSASGIPSASVPEVNVQLEAEFQFPPLLVKTACE